MSDEHEFFVSYYQEGRLRTRCSIERLPVDEIETFISRSRIFDCNLYEDGTLKLEGDYQISRETEEEQIEHSMALEKFEEETNYIHSLEPDILGKWWNWWDFDSIELPEYMDELEYIVTMWNCVFRADEIRDRHHMSKGEELEKTLDPLSKSDRITLAVKYAIENPSIKLSEIEKKFELPKKRLSRHDCRKVIRRKTKHDPNLVKTDSGKKIDRKRKAKGSELNYSGKWDSNEK